MLNKPENIVGHNLLWADQDIHRDGIGFVEGFFIVQVVGGADAGDLGWCCEDTIGQLTGYHIGLITGRDGDNHIGIFSPSLFEDIGVGGAAFNGANIQAFLQCV